MAENREQYPKEYPEKSRYFPYDRFKGYIHGKVLEIGCAEGNNTLFLKKKYGIKEMYCIELDIERLKKAKGKVNAFFANADARWLPFKDNSFDFVYCSEIIEHLPSKEQHNLLVDEIKRVLKQGNYCIITTPNRPLHRIFRLLALKKNDPTHKSELSYGEFNEIVGRTFKNTKILGIFGIFDGLMGLKLFRNIHDMLMKYPGVCKALVAICRK